MFKRELAHLWFENDKIKQEFDTKDLLVAKLTKIVKRQEMDTYNPFIELPSESAEV